MRQLREAGLTLYYLGIESGHDDVLRKLQKGVDSAEMIACARKAVEAEVKLSTMILLGAGGRGFSEATPNIRRASSTRSGRGSSAHW